MKTLVMALSWILMNLLGGWLVAANLFEVGRLGAAATGIIVLLIAWGWLSSVVLSALYRTLQGQTSRA